MSLKLEMVQSLCAKAIGYTTIDLYDHVLLLDDVLNLPNAYKNIMSISSWTRKNYAFHFRMMFVTFILEMK